MSYVKMLLITMLFLLKKQCFRFSDAIHDHIIKIILKLHAFMSNYNDDVSFSNVGNICLPVLFSFR